MIQRTAILLSRGGFLPFQPIGSTHLSQHVRVTGLTVSSDVVTAVLNERHCLDNQLHRRLQQRIHHSPHVYTELALTDTSTVLQVVSHHR